MLFSVERVVSLSNKRTIIFLSVSKKWSTNHFCTKFRMPGNNVKIMFDK